MIPAQGRRPSMKRLGDGRKGMDKGTRIIAALAAVVAAWFFLQLPFIAWMNRGELGTSQADGGQPPKKAILHGRTPDNPQLGTCVFRGTVRTPVGQSAAGALVYADFRPLRPAEFLSTHEGRPRWLTRSDADGRFILEGLPTGSFVVTALEGETHAMKFLRLDKPGPSRAMALGLGPSLPVQGTVADPDGKPIRLARVFPLACEKLKAAANPYRFLPAQANTLGQFTFRYLHPGPWRFLVTARGYAPTLTDYASSTGGDMAVILNQGAVLSGHLMKAVTEQPAAKVKVIAVESEYRVERAQVRTDAHGRFTFSNLRPAEYLITLESDHVVLANGPVQAKAREGQAGAETRLLVTPAAHIRGRVVTGPEGSEEGLAGVRVSATHEGMAASVCRAETDRAGYYRFSGLVAGTYDVAVEAVPGSKPGSIRKQRVSTEEGKQADGPLFHVLPK